MKNPFELSDKFDAEIDAIKEKLNITEEEILYQMAGYLDWKLGDNGKIESEIVKKIKEVY